MKKTNILVITLLLFSKFYTQNSIVFSYDQGGNLIERKLQVTSSARVGNFNNLINENDSLPFLDFKVYPNPTNTSINIEGALPEGSTKADVFILNSNGQKVKSTLYNGDLQNINVSDLISGLYFLEIVYSKKNRSTYKIIVTN